MEFQPNPKLSLEKNLEIFESTLLKERWYKRIAIGIFAPMYPIFWLADQPQKKKEIKEGKEAIQKKLSDPVYFANWEMKEVKKLLKTVQSKIKELQAIEEELDATGHQFMEMDLAHHSDELWEGKRQEVIEKIEFQRVRKRFFQKYLNNLNRLKTLHEANQKLQKITAEEEKELISMLIYEQNMEDQQAEMRFLSEDMGASVEMGHLEGRVEKLEAFMNSLDSDSS